MKKTNPTVPTVRPRPGGSQPTAGSTEPAKALTAEPGMLLQELLSVFTRYGVRIEVTNMHLAGHQPQAMIVLPDCSFRDGILVRQEQTREMSPSEAARAIADFEGKR